MVIRVLLRIVLENIVKEMYQFPWNSRHISQQLRISVVTNVFRKLKGWAGLYTSIPYCLFRSFQLRVIVAGASLMLQGTVTGSALTK